MSELDLHAPEEAVAIDLALAIKPVPNAAAPNPISDYFQVTERLKLKIISSGYRDDAEILGLLALGVISAAEFYVRNVVAAVVDLCPIAQRHSELLTVPSGSFAYYADSPYPHLMSCFDHESFADAAKIKARLAAFTGLKVPDSGSLAAALGVFDRVCELRHCLVHARGYVGLKASSSLQLSSRAPAKVLLRQADALDILKVCHNLVRALNRFLASAVVNRWVDKGHLVGEWEADKAAFERLIWLFWIKGEDAYGGVAFRAYGPYRKAAIARSAALLAKVGV